MDQIFYSNNSLYTRRLTMKSAIYYTLFACSLFLLSSCHNTGTQNENPIYPMYVDQNNNGINDYVEESTHESGPTTSATNNHILSSHQTGMPGHAFVDENGDGICDYAQNGSPTWHGPGFTDENDNSICDYWDQSSPMHQHQQGMRYRDDNDNQINDYFEKDTHMGYGHDFVDENGDGICDYAQDGSATWHGPGFVDMDNDGICDYWQNGGRGHGGMMGGGGPHH